jgi:hypothetical protein
VKKIIRGYSATLPLVIDSNRWLVAGMEPEPRSRIMEAQARIKVSNA